MFIAYTPTLTKEELYRNKFNSSLKKAKILSDRIKMLVNDIDKSDLKISDKRKIKEEFIKTLNTLNGTSN